jgi:fructose/tagatose bisphosphate aldolase
MAKELQDLLAQIEGSLTVDGMKVTVADEAKLRSNVGKLVEVSALGSGDSVGWARYLVRAAALELGIIPASIHALYLARGRGEAPMTWCTPAFNLRALSYHAARVMFRAARKLNAGAFIFEIARSEIGYTGQRPAEYATNILAAAIAEGFRGPVFLQGDHFQISAKRYASTPETEVKAVRDLTVEAISAGFYNIDIDTSTLVDIEKPTIPEQQVLNYQLSAQLGAFIREIEPKEVTISIGGEIGEVGGHNSNEAELRAYMDGYNAELAKLAPGKPGLSKISIQTGTSHGGTVLPDGTIAKVNLDFDTLRELSRVARRDYHLGGTVQHGASTLPEENFNQFVKNEAIEVHLATNFMNMFFDRIPGELRTEIYEWLKVNAAADRKEGMTDEQFFYKTRKNAVGQFKAKAYALNADAKEELASAWQGQFDRLFNLLGVQDTKRYVDQFVHPIKIAPVLSDYVKDAATAEDVSDLAD